MKNNFLRKIVLIGAGNVGVSFLYASMNRGLAQEYGIIDLNEKIVEGHVLDFEDASATTEKNYKIKKSNYSDLKDASVVVITAGRPQRPGETRLEMVADNAKIMKSIAQSVKDSGFEGITVIVANPVDVMTYIYQKVTGFSHNKVISSGTSLDSARLRYAISEKIGVNPQSISAFVMGEHGDSSVSAYSSATISGKPFMDYVKEGFLKESDLESIHNTVYKKAYEIINRKGSTYYGVGSSVSDIVEAIFTDSKKIISVGSYLTGQYGVKDIYIGMPCVIGAQGIVKQIEISLNEKELTQFKKSADIIKENIEKAISAIS